MTTIAEMKVTDFAIPPSVVSKVDVSHLTSELERVDADITSAEVRARHSDVAQDAPLLSEQLIDFLAQNDLSIDDSRARTELINQLRRLKDSAPVIHLTFAVPADRESLSELAQWARKSIHPQAVLAVGLQPALIAGVYVRTSNQVHDLSLRNMLKDGRSILVKELEALRVGN